MWRESRFTTSWMPSCTPGDGLRAEGPNAQAAVPKEGRVAQEPEGGGLLGTRHEQNLCV